MNHWLRSMMIAPDAQVRHHVPPLPRIDAPAPRHDPVGPDIWEEAERRIEGERIWRIIRQTCGGE